MLHGTTAVQELGRDDINMLKDSNFKTDNAVLDGVFKEKKHKGLSKSVGHPTRRSCK